MKISSFNSLYPCKSFQTFSEITDLVHKVAEYLEPKDLIHYALTCRDFKNGAYHRGKELLIKAQHKCSIKWASLDNTHAKKSIVENKKINYSFAQLHSKGWYLQNFGNDLTHHGSPLFSSETANADSEFYKTHITQKECIKIIGCSRQFFAHLLNLPHLKNLKGTAIYSFLSNMCKPIQSISPSLEGLSLSKINDDELVQLTQILETNKTLKKLKLKDFQQSHIATCLTSTLRYNTGIKILDLSETEFKPSQYCDLMLTLATQNRTLEEFKAPRAKFDEEMVKNTSLMLLGNKTIKKITLKATDNSFPEAHLPEFCSGFETNHGIKELNISNLARFTWKQASALTKNPRLESLEICCPLKTDKDNYGFEDFVQSLVPYSKLKTLKINPYKNEDDIIIPYKENQLKIADGLGILGGISQLIGKIERLSLQFFNISTSSVSILSRYLREGSHLTHLDLSRNNLNSDAFIFLTDGLRNNTRLKKLDLSYNCANSRAALRIVNALIENDKIPIETFGLADNLIGEEGREAIIKLIEKNKPTLKHLLVEWNGWCNSKKLYQKLIQSLKKNDYLKYLSIYPIDESAQELREIENAKPWLTIYTSFESSSRHKKNTKMWYK